MEDKGISRDNLGRLTNQKVSTKSKVKKILFVYLAGL